jgi:hypothetical protein
MNVVTTPSTLRSGRTRVAMEGTPASRSVRIALGPTTLGLTRLPRKRFWSVRTWAEQRSRNGHLVYLIMVTWQMRSSLRSSRVIGVTAFGRSSLSFFPLLRGRPLFLLPRWRSCVFWIGALAFADERCHYGVLRSPTSILRNSPQWFVRRRSWRCATQPTCPFAETVYYSPVGHVTG